MRSPRVTHISVPNIPIELYEYFPMTHRMGRIPRPDSSGYIGLFFATRTLQSIPRGSRTCPFTTLFQERRFKRLGYMRCRAHLILSTRLENVFTAVWLTRDY